MAKYILRKGTVCKGTEITEEALQEIYRMHTFTIFNERDYNAWKQSKIEQGVITIAE
jgi:phage antirepressor YoqD-like protein